MACTKRTGDEEENDPHRQPPRRPGKKVDVDTPKRKKQKRKSTSVRKMMMRMRIMMVTMMEMEMMTTLKPRIEPFLALDAKGGVIEGKVKFVGFRGRSTEEKQRAMFLKNGCLYFILFLFADSHPHISCRVELFQFRWT